MFKPHYYKNTPWGVADTKHEEAPGVVFYGTPSHGGYWLSPERQAQLNWSQNWLSSAEWWEEDCDWAIPFYFFREDIKKNFVAANSLENYERNLVAAINTIINHHPDFAQREKLSKAA